MKKRKDSGFTLIELMIVIAVIGILAIVLVPKVGTVKTQAKEAGLDTNVRLVQGYVESKIDKWVSKNIDQSVVVDDIVAAFKFTDDTTKQLVNPITSTASDAAKVDTATATHITTKPAVAVVALPTAGEPGTPIASAEGSVVVIVNAADTDTPVTQVKIYAYGTGGKQLSEKTVTIKP